MSLEKMLRGVVLTGVFALPFIVLYVATSLFFPFITGKNFAFRIIVEIITGAWLCLALIKSEYRPRRSMLLWAFAAFILIIGVADVFGTYPFKSFWSNYERMEGWVTLAHLFAYFVVTTSILNTEKLWRYWWNTSLAVSILISLYGVIQLAGLATINQGGIRLDSRFGNATYLAVYMLFHVFMAALLLARAWVEKGPGKRAMAVWIYGSVIALDTFILFFTATRGAILGLLGGAVLSALILIVLAPRSRVAWRAGTIIVGFILLVVGFWFVHDQAWVKKIEPLHRLATIYSEGFPVGRFLNAQMAIQGFKERPLLGWGQENYSSVFDKNYDPRMYAQEQWFDRTHNIVFDWLIASGVLGLLAYLSLYLCALLALWRSNAFALYERAILTGLIAGYFFYLFFTFDNITSYLFFVSLLAYILVRSQSLETKDHRTGPVPPQVLPILSAVMVLAVGGVIWFVNANMIAANRMLISAIVPQAQGPSQNLSLFKEALRFPRAGTQEIREQLSQATMAVLAAEGVSNDLKQQFVMLAMQEMQKQGEDGSLNARAPFFLGILLDRAGTYPDAKIALERAHELSPRKQSILFELGLNAFAQNKNDEALAFFKEAYELEPEYPEARIYYASALIRLAQDAEADALLAPLIEAGTLSDQRIASAYAGRGRYDKVITIWEAFIAKNPENGDARFLLAGAYYSGGDSARAIQTLEALKRDIPAAAAQVDTLIPQIKSGKVQ